MHTIDVQNAKSCLFKLVNVVACGKEIIISKDGKPAAKLVPYQAKKKKPKFGLLKGKIRIAPDFDKSLPNEILKNFEN